jgi:hypothetical protein
MSMFEHIEPRYDTAQICASGHLVNTSAEEFPEQSKSFCPKCGAKTLIKCEHCNAPIHGQYHNANVGYRVMDEDDVNVYCHSCGKPYPWTMERLQAARALAEELDNLTDAEKVDVGATFQDLLVDTPRTKVALVRFKKLIAKAKGEAKGLLLDLMAKIAVESVRANLGV